jgi:hypothetical protein
MKPDQKTGSASKQQPTAAVPLVCPDPKISSGDKPRFGSPSAAVWTKYIDSRMKQFGTR